MRMSVLLGMQHLTSLMRVARASAGKRVGDHHHSPRGAMSFPGEVKRRRVLYPSALSFIIFISRNVADPVVGLGGITGKCHTTQPHTMDFPHPSYPISQSILLS